MKVYSHSLKGKRESNEDQHINILNLNGHEDVSFGIKFFSSNTVPLK